jgi:restriction system protein
VIGRAFRGGQCPAPHFYRYGKVTNVDITPQEFEQYVKDWFDCEGINLRSYRSIINNKAFADDGVYEIDITYDALGVEFRVLVECKRHLGNIKREVLQVLHQKIQSIGAHKGIVCSTSDFQRGALEYAKKHGIACIKVAESRMLVQTRSADREPVSQEYCDFFGLPKISGYLNEYGANGTIRCSIVDKKHLAYIERILKP